MTKIKNKWNKNNIFLKRTKPFCAISWLNNTVYFFPKGTTSTSLGRFVPSPSFKGNSVLSSSLLHGRLQRRPQRSLLINSSLMDVDLMLNGAGLCLIVQEKPEIQTTIFVEAVLNVAVCRSGHRRLEEKRRMGWRRVESGWSQCPASLVVCDEVSRMSMFYIVT